MKLTYVTLALSLGFVACGAKENLVSSSQISADTSGCSPLLKREEHSTTAQGNSLKMFSVRPNSARCWNVDRSELSIHYSWKQSQHTASPNQVGFWIRANGSDKFVNANFHCEPYGTDSREVSCIATQSLNEFIDRIEIAPVRDGVWDTAGFGQNYKFLLL